LPCITATSPCLSSSLSIWEQIHQTLHTYPLTIDTKEIGLLTSAFTTSPTANYTGYLPNLTVWPIQTGLAGSVAKIHTQHLLGTTAISINNCTSANSTTYFQASLFGKGTYEGQMFVFVWAFCRCVGIGEG
jgi:SnoaL-like domain